MQSYQLGSVGWGYSEPLVLATLGTGSMVDIITGLEFLVGLPTGPLVGQQDEAKTISCQRLLIAGEK